MIRLVTYDSWKPGEREGKQVRLVSGRKERYFATQEEAAMRWLGFMEARIAEGRTDLAELAFLEWVPEKDRVCACGICRLDCTYHH